MPAFAASPAPGSSEPEPPAPGPRDLEAIEGVLLGTAVGDALGLPAEGLPPGRCARLGAGGWRHRLVFGRGMLSDDTEHTLLVAQSLLEQPGDAYTFSRAFARRLRWWLAALPAGVGLATARAALRLWLGVPPNRSGVCSAGNGPAMRSAILGVYFARHPRKRAAYVTASTRVTHTDPRAEIAAQAVALAAATAVLAPDTATFIAGLRLALPALSPDAAWQSAWEQIGQALEAQQAVAELAARLGLQRGVTGYAYHTVPVALYAALRHPDDFRAALEGALACGGDTDTVGAITGAVVGARLGPAAIPPAWVDGIRDWPRSVALLRAVAARLVRQRTADGPLGPVRYAWPGVLPRNLFFLVVVVAHGFARWLSPFSLLQKPGGK
jgi:ADP-ribosylglycohydrolase